MSYIGTERTSVMDASDGMSVLLGFYPHSCMPYFTPPPHRKAAAIRFSNKVGITQNGIGFEYAVFVAEPNIS